MRASIICVIWGRGRGHLRKDTFHVYLQHCDGSVEVTQVSDGLLDGPQLPRLRVALRQLRISQSWPFLMPFMHEYQVVQYELALSMSSACLRNCIGGVKNLCCSANTPVMKKAIHSGVLLGVIYSGVCTAMHALSPK